MRRPSVPWVLLASVIGWVGGAASRPPGPGPGPGPGLDAVPGFPRQELTNLWRIAEWQDRLEWRPFRPGVEIHRLYGDGQEGPTAALLRFREAARVPLHSHPGFEHILILSGSQRDQNGVLEAGTLAIHPPGSVHSVVSEAGCIVLGIYEKSVRFLPPVPPSKNP